MSDEQSSAPVVQTPETQSAPVDETAALNFTNPADESDAPVAEAKSPKAAAKTTKAPEAKSDVKADKAADAVGAEKVAADKFELKVDGETLVLNKEEMIKYAQLGKAGQKRMQEAVEFQKQTKSNWEKLQKALKEDPASVLEDPEIGLNKIELAKKWLAEKLEQDQKSPEQLELEALRKEASTLKREKEEAVKRQREESEAREMEANMKALEAEITTAYKKYGLPKSHATIDRITGLMEFAEKNNIKVTVDDAAKLVRDEIKQDIQALMAQLPDEDFEGFLGEAGVKRIKDNTLKKAKISPKVDLTETAKVTETPEAPKVKRLIKDFMKPPHLQGK